MPGSVLESRAQSPPLGAYVVAGDTDIRQLISSYTITLVIDALKDMQMVLRGHDRGELN